MTSVHRMVTDLKARQSLKIQEIGQALIAAGFATLDKQHLKSHSTAWTARKLLDGFGTPETRTAEKGLPTRPSRQQTTDAGAVPR
jgi:hypothetical protein